MSTDPGLLGKTLHRLSRAGSRWPQPCAVCGSWSPGALCPTCLGRFAAPQVRCPVCALAMAQPQACGRCLREAPAFAATVAAVDYGFPWDRLVTAFKFRQQPEWAWPLSALIDEAIARHPALPAAERVLPVPLSRERLAERGYNQAWQLARRLARRRGLPADGDALLRLRDTPHQVGAGREERLRNLRAAMWVTPAGALRLAGRHLALVDDVLTTGATAQAATQALLAAGAASVQLWVLARTPPPGD